MQVFIPTMRVVLLLGMAVMTACGEASQSETSTAAKSDLSQTASILSSTNSNNTALDANQTLGLQDILPALHFLPREAAWGTSQNCDPNAQRTVEQVCGKPVTTSVVAKWDACKAPMGPPPGGPHPPPMAMASLDSNMAMPAGGPAGGHPMPFDMGTGMGMPPPPPQDANSQMGMHPHFHGGGVSSGNVSLSATASAGGACDANTQITISRQATYAVRVSNPNGPSVVLGGSNTESATRPNGGWAEDANLTLDSNRTVLDANGTVMVQLAMRGNLRSQMMSTSGKQPPQRLLSGSLSVVGADGSTDAVTLTDVLQGPPHACMWPVGGTVQRTAATGTSHTLVFSSTCGQATLDGAAIQLPSAPPHH